MTESATTNEILRSSQAVLNRFHSAQGFAINRRHDGLQLGFHAA